MNYHAWVTQVKRFSENLRALPGEVNATTEVDPPLSADEITGISAKWKTGIPDSLRRLWRDGSSRINCRFVWSPPQDELPRLHEVFEYNDYIYGGVRFQPAQEIFPGNSGADTNDENMLGTLGRRDLDLWCRSAVFLHVGNGDCLGLDPLRNPSDPAVVYLVHDEPESGYISQSFTEFLRDWTELSFIGPELWLLDYWIDHEEGRIDTTMHKTDDLRRLLSPR
jgi:hypothetical protein